MSKFIEQRVFCVPQTMVKDALIGTGLTLAPLLLCPLAAVGVAIGAGIYFAVDLSVNAYSGKSLTKHAFDPE